MTTRGCLPFPRTLLAPMEGVSSPKTRQLIAGYAPIGLVCTPFIRITDHVPSEQYLRSVVAREVVRPVSVQLLGSNAKNLALAAGILRDEGVDAIDLNFGCPSRQVMRKGVGAALLSQPQTIAQIVQEVRRAGSGLLSAKIRGGVDELDSALEIAKVVEDAGVDFLTLHPRAGNQGYAGIADWRCTRRVKAALKIPVVGNGDLFYASDAIRMMAWSGCDAVMLGRGILRNPWIFAQINAILAGLEPEVPKASQLLNHLRALASLFEEELDPHGPRPLGALKEQTKYLLSVVPEPLGSILLRGALAAPSIVQLLEAVKPLESIELVDLGPDGPLRLASTPVDYCAVRNTINSTGIST